MATRPLHILIVFHTSFPEIKGGINKMIATLAETWSREGHRVSILSPGNWEDRHWSSRQHGAICVHRQRLRMPWDPKNPWRGILGWMVEFPSIFWKLKRFVRNEKVDCIHLHTPRDYQWVFRMLRFFGGPPYLLTFHGTDALHFSTGQAKNMRLLRWIAQGASGVTAVAIHYATLIEKHYPDLAPVYPVANGISVGPDPESESSPTLPLALPEHFFIMVGWVEPPKAQDVAIRAWGLLKKDHPHMHLLIVGDEPMLHPDQPYYPGYQQKIMAMLAELKLGATVHLTGSLKQPVLRAIMKKSTGLVFPSQMEGMPYVLLEAGLASLPVVCSDIPAFCELIDPEDNGLLFPLGDHEALAKAIDRIIRDGDWAKRMGKNLNQRVVNRYNAGRMADRYMELFNKLS
ncbi:MAG: hypothetical protein HW380_2853 [Magnetococcales bacterium]|nr:hypothetical protein [Magnetococcales bacterium]HIJ83197.1 glycosyltransferase family 4 protein [Magnetococcales bacterium]